MAYLVICHPGWLRRLLSGPGLRGTSRLRRTRRGDPASPGAGAGPVFGARGGPAPPRRGRGGAALPGSGGRTSWVAAAMAERIEQRLEERLPELEQLERVGLFTRPEIK